VCLVFALCAGGCIVDRTDGVFDEQTIPDAGTIEPDASPTSDVGFGEGPGAGTMTGTWLLAHQASNCVLNQEQVSVAFYLIEIEAEGAVTTETRRTCAFELSPVLGLKPIIPRVVSDNIEFVSVDSGYFSVPAENGAYTSSTEVALWGVELEDPRRDALPTDADDPRVVDADSDGNPGVTFEIEGSECVRYVSQRQVVRYQGIFKQPNLVEGGSLTVTDSVLYGSTQPLCGVDPVLIPNDAFSEFRMARIDGLGGSVDADSDGDGVVSCDEARPWFEAAIARREPDPQNCR
jgi:hypothetical protein